jgi:NAD(P)-dependent dehydrogenase (short-subunit alcohol dehydrogenase family)
MAQFPAQHQAHQPGSEARMHSHPEVISDEYRGSGKLEGKVALITGGDSGIGRAVAVHFAREGASVAVAYLEEDQDAAQTKHLVEQEGVPCALYRGDLGDPDNCRRLAEDVVSRFGRVDVLVNNAAEQHDVSSLEEITVEDWNRTFQTNIHAYFYLTRACLPDMPRGSAIINTTSVNAYKGNDSLIAYATTKGAILTFTRSIALTLVGRDIRVNGVAPGPVWTPLIPASMDDETVAHFGEQVPMGRAAQPSEIAPSYVFLASRDASYFTGQVLHPNGGYIVNA